MIYEDYNYNKGEDFSRCGICNNQFTEGEPVSVIDLPKGPYIIVCKKCVDKLKSVPPNREGNNSNTIELKEIVKDLTNEDKLWRYMDLAKFVSMLKNSAIYFASPSSFEDLYEGAHGELKNKKAWDDFYLSFARATIRTAPDNCWHYVQEETVEEDARRLIKQISTRKGDLNFINCWHQNDYESEAMWKLYSKNVANAIAIQTTFEKLKKQIGEKASIGKVKYIDYSKRFVGINEAYWHKRKAFEFENEVRAIVHRSGRRKDGIEIEIDLNELICNVYISPYAPSWFYELVKDIISKYEYDFDVKYSNLNEIPF